jgi:RNA polymerase sigma-70 factor (ECF subfamily)
VSAEVRQLVERSLQGDAAAFGSLVERFHNQVFGLCYRMLGHRQDAEDATQETFLRVLRSLKHWDPSREFSPWLLAIAGNRCRTLLAARGRRPAPLPLPSDDGLLGAVPTGEHDQQLFEEVQAALQQLREEYRQVFLLFHEQQLSYAEIAAALDCPLGTVKTWVHRARQELARHLRRRDRGWQPARPRT